MSSKIKVITCLGTRPELIKLSRIINKLEINFNHILVNTNQNFKYELNKIFFKEFKIEKPKYSFIYNLKKNPMEIIANMLSEFEKICIAEKPDALIILGDTNSCLVAYVAKRYKIPIFHLEAGNRCFDDRVPEEINRKIIDHLSDINLTYSSIAREYLLSENFPKDRIIKIGSPMYEVFYYYKSFIDNSKILNKLSLKEKNFFLFSFHRYENINDPAKIKKFIDLLKFLDSKYNLPIIVSTHYSLKDKLDNLNKKIKLPQIRFCKPFGYFDYCKLLLTTKIALSDSGTITEESSIMQFPAINLRDNHERPEGMEEAAVIMTGLNINRVQNAIGVFTNKENKNSHIVEDYTKNNVSDKVTKIILSYIDYVNLNVWKKKY